MSESAPTLLEDDELITGEAVALDLRPTDFILRAAGAAIDFVVYFAVWFGLLLAFSTPWLSWMIPSALVQVALIASIVLCWVVIPAVVETASKGKSLGRLAVGARIVRDDGGAIGARHAFIRSMIGVLEIVMTLGSLAALVGLVNARSKRLGDFVAGTYSQHERIARYEPAVFGVPPELAEWAQTADVARMPDPLARRVAQFLRQARHLTPTTRERVARDLGNEVARYVYPVPPAHPELFLAAVAAKRREREAAALALQAERLERLRPTLYGGSIRSH